jgi:twitching motility two-component system response regulator PilH
LIVARVLVIDDSPTDVRVLTVLLERNGFDVVSAASASDGIVIARTQQPDLILMDVIMPGTNGFQATRMLSKDAETAAIPVIIVTTKNMEADRLWGLRQGARDFVTKPPNERDLISRINRLLQA